MKSNVEKELSIYRAMIHSAHDWIVLEDDIGQFIDVRGACESISGYQRKEFLDNPELFLQIVIPEDVQMVQFHIDQVHGQHLSSEQIEFRILRKDGMERWICHSCKPIYNEEGDYLGHLSENRDMTAMVSTEKRLERERRLQVEEVSLRIKEREQINKELETHRQRIELLVESSPDAIFLHDLDSNILSCNGKALLLFGLEKKEELIGKSTLSQMLPEFRQKAGEGIQEVLDKGHVEGLEFSMKKANGSVFTVELSASLMRDSDGNPEGYLSIMRDITLRKRQDYRLHILQKAMDYSPMAILILGLGFKVYYANRALSKLYGLDLDQSLIGQNGSKFFGEKRRVKALAKRLKRSEYWSGQIQQLNETTGKKLFLRVSSSLIRNGDGEPLAYLVSLVEKTN